MSDRRFTDKAAEGAGVSDVTQIVSATTLVRILSGQPLPLSTERALADGIAAVLSAKHIIFEREFRLNDRDRIDFMIPDGAGRIGIEAKIKGSREALVDQVARYALAPAIAAIIVVSSVSAAWPSLIAGKPIYAVHPGRAYLS